MTEVRPDRGDAPSHGRGREAVRTHRREPALELFDGCVSHGASAECGECGEIPPVGVHRPWRALGGEEQQEAVDVGVGVGHGAPTDSPGGRRLLSAVILARLRRPAVVLAAGLLAVLAEAALAAPASASQLIARNTRMEGLAVARDGKALITYRTGGSLHRVLAWGAVNARMPTESRSQVAFRLDYSGGWGTFGRPVWKTVRNACGPYRGPRLPYLVTACTAPDGTHWALQRWQRSRANFGLPPWRAGHDAWELRLSHWSGPLARLQVWLDWSYGGRFHHLFGRLTYRGWPVYGFATTREGDPLDRYGRVLYLDTYDSAYGLGWRRENGFVSRRPDGTFCYGFVPHRTPSGQVRPPGVGKRYRLATSGPGVTPDVVWERAGLQDFRPSDPGDRAYEARMNDLQRQLARGSKPCHS